MTIMKKMRDPTYSLKEYITNGTTRIDMVHEEEVINSCYKNKAIEKQTKYVIVQEMESRTLK